MRRIYSDEEGNKYNAIRQSCGAYNLEPIEPPRKTNAELAKALECTYYASAGYDRTFAHLLNIVDQKIAEALKCKQ